MLTDTELQLNRIAQGLVRESDGIAWFEALPPDQRQQVLHTLARICGQAHPRSDELPKAIERAQLKPTFTPCVLLEIAQVPEKGLHRILALPESEQVKSFRLMIALLAIADARRRESHCKDGCSHEWHNLGAL
mgnify:CR=1 FL=1